MRSWRWWSFYECLRHKPLLQTLSARRRLPFQPRLNRQRMHYCIRAMAHIPLLDIMASKHTFLPPDLSSPNGSSLFCLRRRE